jgi:AcrR family transcriptional regulator
MTRPLRLRPVNRRAQAELQRRGVILSAARQLFRELGFDAVSLRDVARRAGLPPTAVQQLFPDEQAIFRTLVDDSARRLRARVRAARDRATSREGFISEPYRAFFTFVAEDRLTFDLLRRDPATTRRLLEEPTLGASVTELREDIEAAVARGDLPRIDLDYLAAAMAGVAVEVAVRMVERTPPDVEGATAFVSRLFLGGLERLCEAPRRRSPRTRRS